jgi:hypothetical protein
MTFLTFKFWNINIDVEIQWPILSAGLTIAFEIILWLNILEQVLRGEKLQEALPKLETYLQFLYKTVCTPWQDCNNCQEAIKQCYAVKASCYIAN